MKPLLLLSAALLLCSATAQIPGTTRVTAPVAPPAANSQFGGATSRYFNGGYQEWLPSVGSWTSRETMPLGRMSIGMIVSTPADTNSLYILRSISPEVWEPFPSRNLMNVGDHGAFTVNSITGAGGVQATLDPGSVLYSHMQSITTPNTLLGIGTGGPGTVTQITTGAGLNWVGNILSANVAGSPNQMMLTAPLVSDMTNMSPSLLTGGTAFIWTTGRVTNGFGPALFWYNPIGTNTLNLGTDFAHVSLPGRLQYLSTQPPHIDMFGAIPHYMGTNNGSDTAAFVNAMETLPRGSILRLGRGTYRAIGITNNRAISMIGEHASRLSRRGVDKLIPPQGFGTEIEADGDGWIYTIEGRVGYAHSQNPNEEYQLQPVTTENIAFFGDLRTPNAGGMRIANSDRPIVRNISAYMFRKAGFWNQRTVREGVFHNLDIRYCGDADATDSPDTSGSSMGWPGFMIYDDSPTDSLVGDKHNFNIYDNILVSFSLGAAMIVDTLNDVNGRVFNERFRNIILHGYKNGGGSLYESTYGASLKMYTSPLAIIRASRGIEIKDSLFWFTGDNAPYIKYESNPVTGIGSTWSWIEGCTFYGNFNQTSETPAFIDIGSTSSVQVGMNLFRGTDGDTSRPRVADASAIDLDRFFQSGRSVFRELVITNAP